MMISFTPKISSEAKEILNDKALLLKIGNDVGYPYSIIIPDKIKDNIDLFKMVFNKHKLRHKIFFAHKCNQSSEIIKEMDLLAKIYYQLVLKTKILLNVQLKIIVRYQLIL